MGKRSPAPPPAPDYAAAAQQQGQANLESARLTARLSNPNISTPLGGQRVTFGREQFNQSAYDKAMADYNKQMEAYNAAKAAGTTYQPEMEEMPGRYNPRTGEFGEGRMRPVGKIDPTTGMPIAPDKAAFTTRTDLDTPFIEQYLTPEAQATLEAQQRVERALSGLGEQAIGRVSDIYRTPFTPQGLPEQRFGFDYGQLPQAPDLASMGQYQRGFTAEALPNAPDIMAMGQAEGGPREGQYGYAQSYVPAERLQQGVNVRGLAQLPVGAGVTGQQAILSRLAPQLQQERSALETQLRNQGLVPGGEAYNREIQLFNQRANDLTSQAALQGIGLDAQMRAQGFSERQIQAEMANQARQSQFGMGMQQAGLYNQALQQNLAQGMGLAEARNRALAQNQAASMQQYQAALGRQAQGFGQQMDLAGLYNAGLAAQQQSALQQAQAAAALQAQGFNQSQAAAAFQNAQRQAALQEQLALRSQPLNEIAAIMGGAQVQMPQFQAYQGADVAAAPIFGAQQAAGNFAQQNYAQQVAAYNAKMGLYGDVAKAAGTAAASDRRLKSNVVRVGTHPLGIGIYEYDIFGERQRGVMADEVEAVKPEAVTTHPTEGYKMVYYGMLS